MSIPENAKKAMRKHIEAEKAILKELRKKEGRQPVLTEVLEEKKKKGTVTVPDDF